MNPDLPLRDIHLPDAVGWWPLAMGWWLLLALLIVLPMVIAGIRRYIARRRLRKQALASLAEIEASFAQHQNDQQLVSEISVLLRRICISQFPRSDVGGLSGELWTRFLNLQHPSFDADSCRALIIGPFQKQHTGHETQGQCDINSQALIRACRGWIKQLKPQVPLLSQQNKQGTMSKQP